MAPDRAPRLFFALWPDARARTALARLGREIAFHAHGRAPRPESLHLTLAFLGPVAAERLAAVRAAGEAAAASVDAFPLALERVGGTAYGIAWLAPDKVPEALRALHAALAGALERAGFARERRMFRPHVTLARDCVRPAQRGALPPIAWTVDRLTLMASTLAPEGAHYREVAGWPLRGPR
ncbi:MAG: RNA 2',3'-cyclic phosphodiesterase [Burkholderiales bacterium]|nr:RNA 2',3'-cyclic phosphodiesterase [Burkholderiales bacterium]GIK88287.1 MAG: RNA 2',3'-cyclic phosphodiesterase [Betaproteobacteria bacterium]